MKDPIERQDAIDAMTNTLWHYPNECYRNLNKYEFARSLSELGLKSMPSAQPETEKRVSETAQNVSDSDLIFRKAAIDALYHVDEYNGRSVEAIRNLPPAQSERTEKRTETHACDYCHEDSDGYVKPIEKNCHAVIFGSVLYLKAEGWRGEVEIKYCPMCGRRLER